ncbi:hypothetical protein [Aerococcus urinae]|uniref:hypothetical protein n=1 Tax=Aerococcus urinae TaxID=1376 RepID=UPI0025505BD5|nr:hypothetical protein [Aerococcus urinae]MDK7716062.1 hypothetical protein [Aerococcus urinae]
MTEIQNKFIQKVSDFATLNENDEILLSGMAIINKYLQHIQDNLSNTDIDKSDFFISTNENSAWIFFKDTSIDFSRRNERIEIHSHDHSFKDRIIIKDNQLVSEQYNQILSDQLLDKYLSITFKII